jgi:beta-glucosidase
MSINISKFSSNSLKLVLGLCLLVNSSQLFASTVIPSNKEFTKNKNEIAVDDNQHRVLTPAQKKNEALIEQKVRSLIKKMTLDEKIGQMTQITLDVVSDKPEKNQPHKINEEKLKEAILKYHVGSILNVADDKATSIDHWHKVINSIQDMALKDRLKIPVLYGIDSIHGAHYTLDSTIFPQSINVSATWTPHFSEEVGRITALETRASGIPWNFFPVLDIGRQPLWSRLFETYGEDVHLAEKMSRANIKGQQGDDISKNGHVAACMKHYIGYSYPTTGKDKTPANISEKMMREYFLPTFQAAVQTGAETAMINTGEIDGIPGHVNYHLLTEVLKNELQFKGFSVTDWLDIKKLYERDHLVSTPEEGVKLAILAGIDMSMVPYDYSFIDLLKKLVKNNEVPMSRIDDAVFRILRVKYLLGIMENPYPDLNLRKQFATEESRKISEVIAGESITLLKNENQILPLQKDLDIFVTGPTANDLSSLNGGWTLTWQGTQESMYPKNKMTLYTALKDLYEGKDKDPKNKTRVSYYKGVNLNTKHEDYDKALREAKSSDVIILSLGEKAATEIPGNIDDLTLDDVQLQYAMDLYKTGKPVIIVLLESRPRVISKIEKGAQAIVWGGLPGMEGARPLAHVLSGKINPSGKLPFTYPRYPNDLVMYDHKYEEEKEDKVFNPQWAFGHGLSYTKFDYSDLKISKKSITAKDELTVKVKIKNSGKLAGKEVVQLYVSDIYRQSVSPPVKQLKGFEKISLEPNEEKEVQFKLNLKDLSFIGNQNKRIAEKGEFKIQIGNLSESFELK